MMATTATQRDGICEPLDVDKVMDVWIDRYGSLPATIKQLTAERDRYKAALRQIRVLRVFVNGYRDVTEENNAREGIAAESLKGDA